MNPKTVFLVKMPSSFGKKGSFQVIIDHFDCDNDCLTKFTLNLGENLKILTSHLYAHGC